MFFCILHTQLQSKYWQSVFVYCLNPYLVIVKLFGPKLYVQLVTAFDPWLPRRGKTNF